MHPTFVVVQLLDYVQLFVTPRTVAGQAPNIGAPQYIRQILTNINGEINSNTIIVGKFNTPLSMDRSSRQKISKERQALNDTLDWMDLIFVEHSIQKQQNTHFSQVHMEHSPGLATSWTTG